MFHIDCLQCSRDMANLSSLIVFGAGFIVLKGHGTPLESHRLRGCFYSTPGWSNCSSKTDKPLTKPVFWGASMHGRLGETTT
ncbi:hypothetical protein V5799_033445 [Amblyomma americanum]|uniref:Uncharacterized protein n=1 Tax=Amblyomma americanum TaxID=6943 RepID=A0AAQ4DNA5_AMBAM